MFPWSRPEPPESSCMFAGSPGACPKASDMFWGSPDDPSKRDNPFPYTHLRREDGQDTSSFLPPNTPQEHLVHQGE